MTGNTHAGAGTTPPLLEFDNVTVMRGHNIALDSITVRIDRGENVAIIGPNGSGKSTVVKTVTRDCYPVADGGARMRIFGESVWDLFSLRKMLGVVSYDLQYDCHRSLTGVQMVLSGFFGSIGLFPHNHVTPDMRRSAREILEFLDIAYLAEKNVDEMSSGEERRTLIARALVHDPEALILDEPATGLDIRAASRFRSTLSRIAPAGKSTIMTTHHLPDIIPEITRVILLKQGTVFKDGTKEEVVTESNLSELFGAPVEINRRNGYYHAWL